MKKELFDTGKLFFASLSKLTEHDLLSNKLPNYKLRCTHQGYIVGELYNLDDDILNFLDVIEDDSYSYLYFKTVSDAMETLNDDSLFVINANPLTDIGIKNKFITKDDLKNELTKTGLYFNFMDDCLVDNVKKIRR